MGVKACVTFSPSERLVAKVFDTWETCSLVSCTLTKTTNRKKDQQKQPDDELPSGETFRRPTSVRRTLRHFARYFETMPPDNKNFSAAGVSASDSDGDYRGNNDYHGGNEFSVQTRHTRTRRPKQRPSRGANA